MAEVEKGQYVEPSRLTFREFVERWLRDYGESNLASKTLYRYREILYSRVLPAMDHLRLDQIKPIHLVEFYKSLQEDGIRKDRRSGSFLPRRFSSTTGVISSILNDAVEWQVIQSNPAARVKPPKVRKRQVSCFDVEQTAALLAALDKEPLKYKVMVILALATGMRRGELMGLEWRDVDFENNTESSRQAGRHHRQREEVQQAALKCLLPNCSQKRGSRGTGRNKQPRNPLRGLVFSGVPGGIRTPDQRIRSPLLYPAELPGPEKWSG